MSVPIRVQRSRARGWTMPADTVYVGRPTEWGNPFGLNRSYVVVGDPPIQIDVRDSTDAVTAFINHVATDPEYIERVRRELVGLNLACWCPLDRPCHADVLLEIANGTS